MKNLMLEKLFKKILITVSAAATAIAPIAQTRVLAEETSSPASAQSTADSDESSAPSSDANTSTDEASASADADQPKSIAVSADGFDGEYTLKADEIRDPEMLSNYQNAIDDENRDILMAFDVSAETGSIADTDEGVTVHLVLDDEEADALEADDVDLDDYNLYHIKNFNADTVKANAVASADASAAEAAAPSDNATAGENADAVETDGSEENEENDPEKIKFTYNRKDNILSFNTKSFSPFVLTKKTDDELQADDNTAEKKTVYVSDKAEETADSTASPSVSPSAEASDNPSLPEKLKQTVMHIFRAPSVSGQSFDSLKASLSYGADKNGSDYVWMADTVNKGHAFIYRVDYSMSGEGFRDANTIQFTVPKRLLRNRSGNFSDTTTLSIPKEDAEGLTDDNVFVYKEDSNDIIVYNRVKVPAAENGYFEIAYYTDEKTTEYADYNKRPSSDKFTVSATANGTSKTAEAPAVYIDTHSEVTSTTKYWPVKYISWQNEWGAKPSDANKYIYLKWEIRSRTSGNGKYNFGLQDDFTEALVNGKRAAIPTNTIAAYRYQGEDWKVSTDGKVPALKDQNEFYEYGRYDYVVTKLDKSVFYNDNVDSFEVMNQITATVDPVDQIDADTTAVDKQNYKWERPKFEYPTGRFYSRKFGLDFKDQTVRSSDDIRLFGDTVNPFISTGADHAKTLGTLRYDMYMDGYPEPWTIEGDWQKKENHWKKKILYQMTDDDLYLGGTISGTNDNGIVNNGVHLDDQDFDLTSLSLRYSYSKPLYQETEDSVGFTGTDATDKDLANETIRVYVRIKGTGRTDSNAYMLAGTYHIGSNSWTDTSSIVDHTDGKTICFKSDYASNSNGTWANGFRIETENTMYYTCITADPEYTLHDTSTVLNYCSSNKALGIVRNVEESRMFEETASNTGTYSSSPIISFPNRVGTDYITTKTTTSSLSKDVESYVNNAVDQSLHVTWDINFNQRTADQSQYIQQSSGTLYDLLPRGGTYENGSVHVYADNTELTAGDYTVDVNDDCNGSGRTMVTIRINVPANRYEAELTSVHSWDAIKDYGKSLKNSAAYETGNLRLDDGFFDNGGVSSDLANPLDAEESAIMKDLDASVPDDETNPDNRKFVYIKNSVPFNIPMAGSLGLYKKVKAESDSIYSTRTSVNVSENYSYKLRFATDANSKAKDLVLYDAIERFKTLDGKTSDWYGTLRNVNTAYAQSIGIKPVIYYSTTVTDVSKEDGAPEKHTDKWSTATPADLSQVKAVAIDLRKKTDGTDFILNPNSTITCMINMKAPSADNTSSANPTAYNNIYLYNTTMDKDGRGSTTNLIHQDHVEVNLRVKGSLKIKKVSSEDNNTAIEGVTFELKGTSQYGTETDRILKTGKSGRIDFDNIEKGNYTLQEVEGIPDYLEDHTLHNVVIAGDGTVTLDGKTADEYGIFDIENRPRVHGDLAFRKTDLVTGMSMHNAEFKLSGTSVYGTDILMYAKSDNEGMVNFKNVEQGTYKVEETNTLDGYIKAQETWQAVINEDGAAALTKADGTPADTDQYGNATVKNEPLHNFTVGKYSDYDKNLIQDDADKKYTITTHTEFTLTGTSNYGTYVNDTENTIENDRDTGYAHFENLEPGTYVLKEKTAPVVDYNGTEVKYDLDTKQYAVKITKDGTVTIDGLSQESGTSNFVFYDHRRPTGTVTVVKKWDDGLTGDAANARPYPNLHISTGKSASITLNYKSDYTNNDLAGGLLTVKDSDGNTTESWRSASDETTYTITLRPGTYTVSNTAAPDGYDADTSTYALTVNSDGTITGISGTSITFTAKKKSTAYAVFNSDTGELDFIRSKDDFTNGSTGTVNSISGGAYTGTIYTGFETNSYSSSYSVPWCNNRSNIKTVRSVDIIHPISTAYLFTYCSNLTNMDLSKFDTSKVTDMSYMFNGCSKLTALDLSNFDTSKVTNMYSMFNGCSSLASLDVSKFDTSKVTYMSSMFNGCSKLTALDVSNFDTSQVYYMYSMFKGCSSLTALDLSKFNTSNVTNMSDMFNGCSKLTALDLSNFDTSKVTSMSAMFGGCSKLTALDLSSFNTSKVTNMGEMFRDCSSLTSLDVSKFDTSKVTSMSAMFNGCSKLTALDLSNFDTSQVTYMYSMFNGCSSLASLDVSKFDTSKVTDMSSMFNGCSKLTALDLSNFDTSQVTDMQGMFFGCFKLTTLDLSSFNTSKVTNMNHMFNGCSSLTALDVSNFDTSNVTNMRSMFRYCHKLLTIYANSDWNHSGLSSSDMFSSCNSLKGAVSYRGSKTDATMANPTTGYFTRKTSAAKKMLSSLSNLFTKVNAADDTIEVKGTVAWNGGIESERPDSVALHLYRNGTNTGKTATATKTGNWAFTFGSQPLKDSSGNAYSYSIKEDTVKTSHETYTNKGEYIASGTWGTCPWNINADGVLTIGAGTGADTIGNKSPWSAYAPQIISVMTNGTVVLPSDSSSMFGGCSKLTALDLSKFDTSKVMNMYSMFKGCFSLTALDLSKFDTSKVTDMSYMFNGCSKLTALDLSSFNTSKVTDMHSMFNGCFKLTALDLSNFDTSQVYYMDSMFGGCSKLTALDLSKFDTSKVMNMYSMFKGCFSLTALDLSNFDTSKVTDMSYMFNGCSKLSSLYLGKHFIFESTSLPEPSSTSPYKGVWVKTSPYSADAGLTSAALQAKYGKGTDASPERARWYWKQDGYDKNNQQFNSADGVVYNSGAATEIHNVYDPSYAGTDYASTGVSNSTASFTDASGNSTGYWQKVDDKTWTYTFYVYDPNANWMVWEDPYTYNGKTYTTAYAVAGKTYDTSFVTLPKDAPDKIVTVTNTNKVDQPKYGGLKISKTLAEDTVGEIKNVSFPFTVTLTDENGAALSGTKVFGGIAFTDGTAKVSVKSGSSTTITDIPENYHYTVTEDAVDGYTQTSLTNGSGVITGNTMAAVTCKNSKPHQKPLATIPLTIKKTCANDTNTKFSLHVSFNNLVPLENYSYTEAETTKKFTVDAFGSADVDLSLKHNETAAFTKIPVNATYQVSEDANNCIASYTIADSMNEGMIANASGANDEPDKILSTVKETADLGEDVTVTFNNTVPTYKVKFAKKDNQGGFVEDAVLQILDSKKNTVSIKDSSGSALKVSYTGTDGKAYTDVPGWKTVAGELKEVSLEAGSYYLHEAFAPRGYGLAADVPFTIGTDGKITSNDQQVRYITMTDAKNSTSISIEKTDGKNPLLGAELEILADDKKTVYEKPWTTDGRTHIVNLEFGKTYYLREVKAPESYKTADDIKIAVDSKGVVTWTANGKSTVSNDITMIDPQNSASISISKKDGSNAFVKGAKLEILNTDRSIYEPEWTTGDSAHESSLEPGKTYYLHETYAPAGYMHAADITITVSEDGTVTASGQKTTNITMIDRKKPYLPITGSSGMIAISALAFAGIIICSLLYRKAEKN